MDGTEKIQALADLPDDVLRALLVAQDLPAPEVGPPMDGGLLADIDWAALRQDANRHALGVQVFRRLEELGWSRFVPPAVTAAWRADARHAELQFRLQEADALQISRTLKAHGVRHALVKGAGYRRLLYQPPWIRLCGDADLLIDAANIEIVRGLMHGLGFQHAACTLDYQGFRLARQDEIIQTEAEHYELAQLVKSSRLTNTPDWLFGPEFERRAPYTYERQGEDVVFRSVVDVHWALHFSLQYERPLDSVVEVPLDEGETLPILSPGWSLFVSAFKLYYEAFDRPGYGLHHLVDIAGLLHRGLEPEDWALVGELTARHGYQAALFYTLAAAEGLVGAPVVPAELIQDWSRLEPAEPGAPVRDLGDFVPWMLGRRTPSAFLRDAWAPPPASEIPAQITAPEREPTHA
jgi:hypothetical protein